VFTAVMIGCWLLLCYLVRIQRDVQARKLKCVLRACQVLLIECGRTVSLSPRKGIPCGIRHHVFPELSRWYIYDQMTWEGKLYLGSETGGKGEVWEVCRCAVESEHYLFDTYSWPSISTCCKSWIQPTKDEK
jgi:hypothetical protein